MEQIAVVEAAVPEGLAVEEVVAALRRNPDILYAEPDFRTRLNTTPNDEYFGRQYALYNPGSKLNLPGSPTGKSRADIHATAAWEETKGGPEIIVAVVDTGVDYDHPDLANKVVSKGKDFIADDDDAADDNGHGTHVAGIIAADTNNGQGIAGVAWNCRVLPLKTIDREGNGFYSELIEAILGRRQRRERHQHESRRRRERRLSCRDALRYAFNRKIISRRGGGQRRCGRRLPRRLRRVRPGRRGHRLQRRARRLRAPAARSTSPLRRRDPEHPAHLVLGSGKPALWLRGRDIGGPHVTGLAALLKGLRPWLSAKEIMQVIRFTADDVNADGHPGANTFVGYGRVNMERAASLLQARGGRPLGRLC